MASDRVVFTGIILCLWGVHHTASPPTPDRGDVPSLRDTELSLGWRLRCDDPSHCTPRSTWITPVEPLPIAQCLILRGAGRKLQAKKKTRGGGRSKSKGVEKHFGKVLQCGGASGLSRLSVDAEEGMEKEGPKDLPIMSNGDASLSRHDAQNNQKRVLSEFEEMIKAAEIGKENDEGHEEKIDEVGLPYQQPTPLTRGHVDTVQQRDAHSYCAEAARCLEKFEIEGAEACYEEALRRAPQAAWILNAYGSLLADQGRVDEAAAVFEKSVAVDFNASHVPHMYLGQVYEGANSLRHLRAGVCVLEQAAYRSGSEQVGGSEEGVRNESLLDARTIPAALCSARCALAEALLAEDDTGGADEEAEAILRAAMLALPQAADAHQSMASLRLSQGRKEEAGAYLQSVLAILADTRLECLPSIDFRLQTSKLLLEVGQVADAIRLLRGVQKEKDYLAELWYLLCFAHRLKGDEEAVHEAALRGMQHLRSVGGSEQARHPVTGEVLTVDDFKDVMAGYKVSDRDVDEMVQEERKEAAAAQRQAIAISKVQGAIDRLPPNALQEMRNELNQTPTEEGESMADEESEEESEDEDDK